MKPSETLKTKIMSVSPLLIGVITSGMVSTATKVKGSTLVLLISILEHYPELICHSFDILKKFHRLICVPLRKLAHQQSQKYSNLAPILLEGNINNENYKKQVFDALKLFLREMLKDWKIDPVEDNSDEQEIRWNCKGTLYLETYACGGLKPVDIEKSTVSHFKSQILDFDNYDYSVHEGFSSIIQVIKQTFQEEFPKQCNPNDNLPASTIQNVSVLLQVLCHIVEFNKFFPCELVDTQIKDFLLNEIYQRDLFPFHSASNLESKQSSEAIELNLAVCYLHSKCIFGDKLCKDTHNEETITYIKNAIACKKLCEIKDSIPMFVKILETYCCFTNEHHNFITDVLNVVADLLRNQDKVQSSTQHLNKKALISLFAKFSLNPSYDFLIESSAMKKWFSWLLTQVTDIRKTGKVDKSILRLTKTVAGRNYPSFHQALAHIEDRKFKDLLSFDDPDVRDTVISLIYHMKNISDNLFEDLSNVILLDETFPFQWTVIIIRRLTERFAEFKKKDVDIKDYRRSQVSFIQFLLNIAVASLDMDTDTWFDLENNDYVKLVDEFKDAMPYNIYPCLHWKEHSKLFDICQKSLSVLPKKLVDGVSVTMMKELLDHNKNLPMHCAIAILKLIIWEVKDAHYRSQINNLMFSTLFTISLLTNVNISDEWYGAVMELYENIKLNRRLVLDTILQHIRNSSGFNGIIAFNILRIYKVYLDNSVFKPEDGDRVLTILQTIKDKCSDKTFEHQPLYKRLFQLFYYIS